MPFSSYKTIDSVLKEFQVTYTQANFIVELSLIFLSLLYF